jgi:hypothetical protein
MVRPLALGLGATVALAMAGCHQSGSYRVTWNFLTDASGCVTQNAAAGCGQNGVDAVMVTAADTSGDTDEVLALCTPGQVTRAVAKGSWTIQIQAVDAEGALIPSLVATTASPVSVSDGTTALLTLTLGAAPACGGGGGDAGAAAGGLPADGGADSRAMPADGGPEAGAVSADGGADARDAPADGGADVPAEGGAEKAPPADGGGDADGPPGDADASGSPD